MKVGEHSLLEGLYPLRMVCTPAGQCALAMDANGLSPGPRAQGLEIALQLPAVFPEFSTER